MGYYPIGFLGFSVVIFNRIQTLKTQWDKNPKNHNRKVILRITTIIIYIKKEKERKVTHKITIMAIYKRGPQHVIRRWLKSLGLKRAFRKGMYEYVDTATLHNLEQAQLQCGLCFLVGSTALLKYYQIF